MSEPADWVPDLIQWNDYGGTWDPYIAAVYAIFKRDMIDSVPILDGMPVRCRRDPIFDGYLWFNEEYLIALGIRRRHLQLITAFHTGAEHTRRKLRKEKSECQKN